MFAVWLAGIPVMAFVRRGPEWATLVVIPWGCSLVTLMVWTQFSQCPRCGGLYFWRRWISTFWRGCPDCGVRLRRLWGREPGELDGGGG